MTNIASQLFSLYDEEIVTAAKRIFNTYGGKRMNNDDRIVALIDYARHCDLTGEQMAEVLHLLDEVVDNPQIDDFEAAEQAA